MKKAWPCPHRFCTSSDPPHFDEDMPICRARCWDCTYTRRTPNCPPELMLDYTRAWELAEAHANRHPSHRVDVYSI